MKTKFPKLTETDLCELSQQEREGERVNVNRSSHRDGSSDRAVRLRGISGRQHSIYRPGQEQHGAEPTW